MLIMLAYLSLWIALLVYNVQARLYKPLAGRLASGSLLVSWGLLSTGLIQRGLEAGMSLPCVSPGQSSVYTYCWKAVGVSAGQGLS